MILKIYNTEVIDCSSSWNEVIPSPESRLLLIDIFIKICESDAVRALAGHSLNLDFKGSLDEFHYHTDLEFNSPLPFGHISQLDYKHSISSLNYQTGAEAENNKINGLFIESAPLALERIGIERRYMPYGVHLLPPGLRGIKRSISIVRSYLSHNYKNLPTVCPHLELKNFEFGAVVIWNAWTEYREDSEIGQYISGEYDHIRADSRTMQLHLGGICEGGQQGRENGAKHYPDIQKVLEEYWPNQFEVRELNGG
jgi:hypothetical protein